MLTKTFVVALLLALFTIQCNSGQAASDNTVFLVDNVTPTTAPNKVVDFTWMEKGKKVSFSEFTKGKVVLLNIWASWCGPCKREIPDLAAIHNEFAGKGAMVFGVSVDQDDRKLSLVKSLVDKVGVPYHNVIDNLKIAESIGIQSIPVTLVIDETGKVVQRINGMQSKENFVAAINRVLKKG